MISSEYNLVEAHAIQIDNSNVQQTSCYKKYLVINMWTCKLLTVAFLIWYFAFYLPIDAEYSPTLPFLVSIPFCVICVFAIADFVCRKSRSHCYNAFNFVFDSIVIALYLIIISLRIANVLSTDDDKITLLDCLKLINLFLRQI